MAQSKAELRPDCSVDSRSCFLGNNKVKADVVYMFRNPLSESLHLDCKSCPFSDLTPPGKSFIPTYIISNSKISDSL